MSDVSIPVCFSWVILTLSIIAAIAIIRLWRAISKLEESADTDIKKRNHK